ncbi:hypothetical protein RCO48_02995 [Peribacillus frigoritolerans]|nr:hypothetical protein [Peribacillus frigoritolerans]
MGKCLEKGEYTIYNGREYRFIESDTVEAIELISNDKKDMDNGFTYYKNNIYTKMVGVSEVKELYSINPYAVYKGEVFPASEEKKNWKCIVGYNKH